MTDILVTGGAGYIGAHACKALSAAGYRPVAFDDLCHGHREAVKWGPLEVGNVLDRERLGKLFEAYDFAGVMHFAAFIAVGESVADPGKYYRNNVGGTMALLEAMCASRVSPLIFSSTAAVYGLPEAVPIIESAPLNPINPYGWSKLTSERMIADHGSAHGLNFALLRYFNACGADPSGEIGERHDPETHLIPLALRAAAGRGELTLFGDDYPTADGTCVRDYIHVTDLAEAHVAALQALLNGAPSIIANLGTGQGISNRQVIDAVGRVTGRHLQPRVSQRRPGDPPVLVADSTLAQRLLRWRPTKSDLETIVGTAWAWEQKLC